jgi:hypothetical protein
MTTADDHKERFLDDKTIADFAALGVPRLLAEILACPCPHHAPVRPDVEASTLVCGRCQSTFPVRDGVPVMLLDDATAGPEGIGAVVTAE